MSETTDAASPMATPESDAEKRRRLSADPHRPRYHFVAPANWQNDPNGLIQWDGVYHLFYQYDPNHPQSTRIHWGHAVSPDLVHWTDWPIALSPEVGTPDQDGCWSGCAVDDRGVPTIVYTGVRGADQLPCIATSRDGLMTWEKYAGNPVAERPAGVDLVQFRDPSVWRDGDTWNMLIGAGIVGVGGTALLYQSQSLHAWEYRGPIYVGDVTRHEPFWTGTMWECPQLFHLDGKDVLCASVWHTDGLYYAAYYVGTYADGRFTPEGQGIFDVGGAGAASPGVVDTRGRPVRAYFYAPQSMLDDAGRRIMWGWLREGRGPDAIRAAGWASAMSLPRILSLLPDGTIGAEPAPEIRTLRADGVHHDNLRVSAGSLISLDAGNDACQEIVADVDLGDAQVFSLLVRRSPDGKEQTDIRYERATARLLVDRDRASLDPATGRGIVGGVCPLEDGSRLRLQVFVDRSIIEIFANGRLCITERVYPTRPDTLGVALAAEGGTAVVRSLDVWRMRSNEW
ncbi:MAG: glycoside hydrolase family 32 protein [Chloroflexi bacterium]|nr:glycoside hydrolase family 32 protein [Chloroflexota bacterium]